MTPFFFSSSSSSLLCLHGTLVDHGRLFACQIRYGKHQHIDSSFYFYTHLQDEHNQSGYFKGHLTLSPPLMQFSRLSMFVLLYSRGCCYATSERALNLLAGKELITKIFWGPWDFWENYKKSWQWLATLELKRVRSHGNFYSESICLLLFCMARSLLAKGTELKLLNCFHKLK